MNVDCMHVLAEDTAILTAGKHARYRFTNPPVDGAHCRRLLHLATSGPVLGDDKAYEVLMLNVIIVGELDDAVDCLRWRQVIDV